MWKKGPGNNKRLNLRTVVVKQVTVWSQSVALRLVVLKDLDLQHGTHMREGNISFLGQITAQMTVSFIFPQHIMHSDRGCFSP